MASSPVAVCRFVAPGRYIVAVVPGYRRIAIDERP
jgi:hypothetical protein